MKNNSLSATLQKIALINGKTQSDLSKQAGLTEATVSRFFNDKSDIKLSSFVSLLEQMDIDINYILNNELKKKLGLSLDKSAEQESLNLILEALPKSARTSAVDHILALSKRIRSVKIQKARQHLSQDLSCGGL